MDDDEGLPLDDLHARSVALFLAVIWVLNTPATGKTNAQLTDTLGPFDFFLDTIDPFAAKAEGEITLTLDSKKD